MLQSLPRLHCVLVLLQTLVSSNTSLSLSAAVALAAAQQPISVTQQQQEAVLEFVGRRLEQLLIDAGVSAEAGTCLAGRDVAGAHLRCQRLALKH